MSLQAFTESGMPGVLTGRELGFALFYRDQGGSIRGKPNPP
ncbi:hypothetical protein HMPREF9374_3968 [Desmospora sp. 8437]|nr:hypothetical protein HMPREF9374_3968 [Desmospora sp. 8437]